MTIRVLDLTIKSRYVDGSPWYDFHTSFPSRGVRKLTESHPTKEGAFEQGKEYIRDYQKSSFPGGMGEVLGVTEVEGRYHAVVNTYYSNT